jgi:hypothetical protein
MALVIGAGAVTVQDNPGFGLPVIGAIAQYLLIKLPAGVVTLTALDTNNDWIGVTTEPRTAAGQVIPIRFRHAGTMPGVTADATAIAIGVLLYKGAAGTVTATSTGSVAIGISLSAVTGAGLWLSYMPY